MHEFIFNAVMGLFTTLCSLLTSIVVFRFWVTRKLRDEIEESLFWCAVMLFTIEMRLGQLQERIRIVRDSGSPAPLFSDRNFSRTIRRMHADIEAFRAACDSLILTLSLPLSLPHQKMCLAAFSSSSVRCTSELQRAVGVLNGITAESFEE
ncbi:MAG: hypothetical protein ACO26U_15125, partial [Burkholderiaceae bacterium]